jgi:omega-6 fatty acid desaturase (delta-12 desaturase)
VGDIYTMTLQEYLEATPWQRFAYRVYRNPFVMFFIGPIYVMLSYRLPLGYGSEKPSVRNSVALTNLFLVLLLVGIYLAFGLKTLTFGLPAHPVLRRDGGHLPLLRAAPV